jgi:nuclear pore complex protein Nup85
MTTLLLTTLKAHPQRSIAAFAQILISAAHALPRSNNVAAYPTERSFVLAHSKWRAGVRAQITAFTRGKERSGGWLELEGDDEMQDDDAEADAELADQARNFETFFMHVADLLLGDTQAVIRESEEWAGAMAVWGVLVEPGLKRDDLP